MVESRPKDCKQELKLYISYINDHSDYNYYSDHNYHFTYNSKAIS